jgi:lysozyme family protein
MSADNYKPSLSLVLAHEGGYVNNPKDPGGPTNFGVTQVVYDAYRDYMHLKRQSVKFISSAEVNEIYMKNYWRLVKGDSLPAGLDYAVFDFAVNSGVGRAIKYLQRLVKVDDDGAIGFGTLTAINKAAKANEEALITQYCANRLAFMQSLKTFATFGKGWTRRVVGAKTGYQQNDTGVIDYAVGMARKDQQYTMPSVIGALPGEVVGKAVASLDPATFVMAPETKYAFDLKNKAA